MSIVTENSRRPHRDRYALRISDGWRRTPAHGAAYDRIGRTARTVAACQASNQPQLSFG